MKHLLRVPTNEQYAYIEQEFEGTPEGAVEAYDALTRLVKVGTGLELKPWNDLVDSYLETGSMSGDPGDLENLNAAQKWFVNEVKKSIKRRNEN